MCFALNLLVSVAVVIARPQSTKDWPPLLGSTKLKRSETWVYLRQGAIRALSRKDGLLEWEHRGFSKDSLLYDLRGGCILVRQTGGEASLVCLTESGKTKWKLAGEEGAFNPLCVVTGRWLVYFPGGPALGASAMNPQAAEMFTRGLRLNCVDAVSGRTSWSVPLSKVGMPIGAPALGDRLLTLHRRSALRLHATRETAYDMLYIDARTSRTLKRWHVNVSQDLENTCASLTGLNLMWSIRHRGNSLLVTGVSPDRSLARVYWRLAL